MKIGIDLDNTIICYDNVFFNVAYAKNWIPHDLDKSKVSVKDYLQKCNKNDVWTELQGLVYGPKLIEAKPYKDVVNFIGKAKNAGHEVIIISHKTNYSMMGKKYDLIAYAKSWMLENNIVSNNLLNESNVFFAPTRRDKVDLISSECCDIFIDDLIEVFNEPGFPEKCIKYLFSPNNTIETSSDLYLFHEWNELMSKFF